MPKSLITLLVLLCTTFCFSQNITIKGKITDPADLPLEAATIYLTSVKDSSVVNYTISDKNGNWEMRTHKITEPVYLKASFISFTDHKQEVASIEADRDFGTIKMADAPTQLDAVVIESEVPPIRIKSDTLEFNASSFKVRPDANVEALLKQLPGVDIDPEGKITVNGKEVNEVLVDGKRFFGSDGKVALQNLPAEIIDKVQVSDTKTEKEKMTGRPASGNNASINLTLEDGKNKGLFGKVVGGYGSDERYESSGLLNYFKDDLKISVLAASNNINSTGFTQNEIFDSMGGGRSIYTSSDGSFGINGVRFGAGRGITRSDIFGANYSDEWFKGFDANGSYFYTAAESENRNRSRRETFLPADEENPENNRSLISESQSDSRSLTFSHNASTDFRVKIDSTARLHFRPRFVRNNSKDTNSSRQATTNQDGGLLNESNGSSLTDSDKYTFESSLTFNKMLNKKGRSVTVEFDNSNDLTDSSNLNQSTTLFYENDGGTTSDIRNQAQYNRQAADSYNTSIEYAEPITDSLEIKVGSGYNWQQNVEDRAGFDYDNATGRYTAKNELLTNYLSSSTGTFSPYAGFQINKNKITLDFTAGTNITQFKNFGAYLGEEYRLNKEFILPDVQTYIRYNIAQSVNLSFNYNYNVNFPNARQVLPIVDVSSPLYTFTGNPDLDPNKSHSMYLNFHKFDFATRSGYFFYGGGSYYDSQITNYSFIDESAKTTTTYKNIGGAYNLWLGGNWSKSVKKDEHSLRYQFRINANYGYNKGFLNGELYTSRSIGLSPQVNFTWDYGELLTINPSYTYDYDIQNYTNFTRDKASNFVHRLNLQTTSYWPKHVVFGNDFAYTYNSQIAPGFKKDFFMWNTSIGYNFFEDKLLFKVKVYDVLNQNVGTSRSITDTSIYDQENTVLRRYIMFSLTFKIKKFAGKESGERNRFFIF